MPYLEEWSSLETEYIDSLSGIVEALTATILCLPVDGAKVGIECRLHFCHVFLLFRLILRPSLLSPELQADIQDVKNAVGSAVDIMQTIGSSICSLLAKVLFTPNYFLIPAFYQLLVCQ